MSGDGCTLLWWVIGTAAGSSLMTSTMYHVLRKRGVIK